MGDTLGVGIIGCGNISTAYLTLAPLFKGLEMRAVADINMDAANAQANAFGVTAQSVDDLLSNGDIDVVVNLTIPLVLPLCVATFWCRCAREHCSRCVRCARSA